MSRNSCPEKLGTEDFGDDSTPHPKQSVNLLEAEKSDMLVFSPSLVS